VSPYESIKDLFVWIFPCSTDVDLVSQCKNALARFWADSLKIEPARDSVNIALPLLYPDGHSSPGTRLNIGQIGSGDDISRFSSRDFSIENVQCLKMRPFIEPATFEVDRDLQRRVKAVRAMFYNHFPALSSATAHSQIGVA
jgi:hypothetical protein